MLLDLSCTTPPDGAPIDRDTVKRHVRIEDWDDVNDADVDRWISAATSFLDGYGGVTGRALMTQTWRLYLPGFWASSHPDCRHDFFPPGLITIWPHGPRPIIRLPLPPLQSVTSIVYKDVDGNPQTLDPSLYLVLDGVRSEICAAPGETWPETQQDNPRAVTITFVAGYGDATKVPPPAITAMLLLIGHMNAHREAVVGVESRDSSTPLPIGVWDNVNLIKRWR